MDIGILRRDGRSDPFFDGAAADRLVIKRCACCEAWLAPDQGGCPDCGTDDLAWTDASGEATLVSWTIVHGRPGSDAPPAFLALVELAEGPWLHTRLDGVERSDLREGLPLRASFEHPDEGEPYLLFRPAA